MSMIKIANLTVVQLKELLRSYDLPDVGLKPALIQRLIDHLNVDEIDSTVLNNNMNTDNTSVQMQIDVLKDMMEKMVKTVSDLASSVSKNDPNEQNLEPVQSEVNLIDINDSVSNVGRVTPVANYEQSMNVKSNLRDIVAILPEFDPLKECLSARQFIDKVDSLAGAYGWSDGVKLYATQMKLKGHAKSWVDVHDVFKTWPEFVEALLSDFPCEINIADIHIEMVMTIQTRNETILDYFYKMLSLGRRGKLDDKSIIRHIINGLYDENMRRTLNTQHFDKCAEFLKSITGIHTGKPVTQTTTVYPRVKTAYTPEFRSKKRKTRFQIANVLQLR